MDSLAAGVVTYDEAIVGSIRIDLALASLAPHEAILTRTPAHASTALDIHPLGQAVRVADTGVAGINLRELADTFNACACAAGVEDRALFVRLAVLVTALAKATLISRLAVDDRHDADAIVATVVDAGVVLLLATAVAARFTRAPAPAINARLALVASAAGIYSR